MPKSGERAEQLMITYQKMQKKLLGNIIELFPHVESHYCRAKPQKSIINPELNINRLYNLYYNGCVSKNLCPVKQLLCRSVFINEYNFGFLAKSNHVISMKSA